MNQYDTARRLGYRPLLPRDVRSSSGYIRQFITAQRANAFAALTFTTANDGFPLRSNSYSGYFDFHIHTRRRGAEISAGTLMIMQNQLETLFLNAYNYVVSFERLRGGDRVLFLIVSQVDGGERIMASNWYEIRQLGATRAGQIVFNNIKDKIQETQSEFVIPLDRAILRVKYYRQRSGGAYVTQYSSFKEFAKRKRFILDVESKEGVRDCFYQCIVLGQYDWMNRLSELRKRTRVQSRRTLLATQLRELCNMHQSDEPVELSQIGAIEDKIRMRVYVLHHVTFRYIYTSPKEYAKSIFLILEQNETSREGHFYYVSKDHVGSIWNHRKFCYNCLKGFDDTRHKCLQACVCCKSIDCGKQDVLEVLSFFPHDLSVAIQAFMGEEKCPNCGTVTMSADCMRRHVKKCKQKRCSNCFELYSMKSKITHICGFYTCYNCRQYVAKGHQCFHQVTPPKDEIKLDEHYIFYDFECIVDQGEHIPVIIIAMTMKSSTPFIFDSLNAFVDWLDEYRGYTCIAHNGGRYDMHFIKRCFLKRGIQTHDTVRGNTLFSIYVKSMKIRFIDSYRFIPMGLRQFPKTFNLKELSKGYFPYRFFTKETISYRGALPSVEWFDFHHLSPEEREKAQQWYREHENDVVDLMSMCVEYCKSDVLLLKEGCIQFRNMFLQITQNEIDPFKVLTIASVCMSIYRRFYMPSGTIGVLDIREESYDSRAAAECWYRTFDLPLEPVEGIYNARKYGSTLYVFENCLDTGCTSCFSAFTIHPFYLRKCHELAYEYQSFKKNFAGTIITEKQCRWKPTPEMIKTIRPRAVMRDAFFGGRTEPLSLYYKVKEGEKIRYFDFTSLYPSVQYGVFRPLVAGKTPREIFYPVGHCVRITENFGSLDRYFGFICCKIACPVSLYIPLLPERKDGKLIFDCTTKVGTWTSIEIQKALQLGYVIEEIYEIIHFPNRSSLLFKDYVETFLKIKQEAAGWQKLGVIEESEKMKCLAEYEAHQGIALDINKISEYNPGLYFIAKLCLNSLWGKFGQRDQFVECKDTFSMDEFYNVLGDAKLDLNDIFMHDSEVRTISYKKKKPFAGLPTKTNIAIAAFTTAHARLRLYEVLEILQERVLYMDTDSVIFIDRGENLIQTGKYLGEMTDELNGDYITEFVSTGPKCYAYKTAGGKEALKIKGFTLSSAAQETIHFDFMKELVLEDRSKIAKTQPLKFNIGKNHAIQSHQWRDTWKKFGFTFNKRHIVRKESGIFTLPFEDEDEMV